MFHTYNWISKRTALSADRIALIDIHTGERLSYAMLQNRIDRWASFFHAKGFTKGDRIAVYSPNKPELFAILFACERAGLIYVPLNWRLSQAELQGVLDDCQPVLMLYDEGFEASVQPLQLAAASRLTVIEQVTGSSGDSFEVINKPEDPWMIIYTGGTTGAPKGVVLSYSAINWNALNTIATWGLTENDVTINYMPLFHTGGLNALSIPLFMAGGIVVIGHQFDAEAALRATNDYEATISLFVPTMYQMMIQTDYFKRSSFPSMACFLSGGAPCPETVYRSFYAKGLCFKEGYGLTEAGPNNFFIRPVEAVRKIGSVGKSMLFNDIAIRDEKGNLCLQGEIGELFVKGPHMFSGYWNNPAQTTETIQDGWIRTGDLAKVDSDGDTYIVGRKKDMIITGGENVYPQEVEQCLITYDGIREVAVVGMSDDVWGEKVVAFVSVHDNEKVDRDSLLSHCKHTLASYKIPKEIIVVPELPKTPVGKINKNELLARL